MNFPLSKDNILLYSEDNTGVVCHINHDSHPFSSFFEAMSQLQWLEICMAPVLQDWSILKCTMVDNARGYIAHVCLGYAAN